MQVAPLQPNNLQMIQRMSVHLGFKKDTIWKPLIRLFRRYLKKHALSMIEYERIHDRPLQEQGQLFC